MKQFPQIYTARSKAESDSDDSEDDFELFGESNDETYVPPLNPEEVDVQLNENDDQDIYNNSNEEERENSNEEQHADSNEEERGNSYEDEHGDSNEDEHGDSNETEHADSNEEVNAGSIEDEHQDYANEAEHDDKIIDPTPDAELNNYLIQDRVPTRGDIIKCFSEENQNWFLVTLDSNMIRRHHFYFNCIFPDNSRGRVHLVPGDLWSFLEPLPDGSEDTDRDNSDPNDDDETVENEIENVRNNDDQTLITPDASSPDVSLLPSEDSDAFFDDNYSDQLEISNVDLEIDAAFGFLNRAFSLSAHPNLELPPDMSIEENRVYNLTSVLNLDIPCYGNFVTERNYLLPQEHANQLLYQRNPFIDNISPEPEKKQKFKFLPKYIRRLNPFRKK